MKNLPAIVSIATVAVLLLLAIAASFIDSLPFLFIASYVVGFGASIGFLALFIADYAPRSPRLIAIEVRQDETQRASAAKAVRSQHWLDDQGGSFIDPITVNLLATLGVRSDSTLSTIS
jgi:predicted O-methyltransferase YrrM